MCQLSLSIAFQTRKLTLGMEEVIHGRSFVSPHKPGLDILWGGGGRGDSSFVHGRSGMTTGPRISLCRDGVRRVFTNEAGIACTKREAP